jgi:hypothetical protein
MNTVLAWGFGGGLAASEFSFDDAALGFARRRIIKGK